MYYISLSGVEFYTKMHRFSVIKQKECTGGSSFLFFFSIGHNLIFKNVLWLNMLSYLERCIDWKVVSVSGLFVPKCLK